MAPSKSPFLTLNEADVVVGRGDVGVDAKGLGVIGESPIEVALVLLEIAPVAEGVGPLRVQSNHLGVVGRRARQVSLGLTGQASPIVDLNGFGDRGSRPCRNRRWRRRYRRWPAVAGRDRRARWRSPDQPEWAAQSAAARPRQRRRWRRWGPTYARASSRCTRSGRR